MPPNAVENRGTFFRHSSLGYYMEQSQGPIPRWIRVSILIGAGFFIFALILSAVFDPRIRLLHALQALIYVAVIVLTRRDNAWGFGAGTIISALWNYTNIFFTTFIRAGLVQLWVLLHTGQLHRPDLMVAVVAAAGHFLLIFACLAGFLRLRPKAMQWGQFLAGGVLAAGYFMLIIFTTGPQYIGLMKRVFHM